MSHGSVRLVRNCQCLLSEFEASLGNRPFSKKSNKWVCIHLAANIRWNRSLNENRLQALHNLVVHNVKTKLYETYLLRQQQWYMP
ncbi:hypothetical protein I79_001446 [Cricetulus griseus]|uniref:Uncharacterized protein n=1 Tax=Cricetulus griseus TaxID=10029 RepID=G3GUS3_CRIGR|nr:hypothetical protein I79_001446 [Cricetulus griseus]